MLFHQNMNDYKKYNNTFNNCVLDITAIVLHF